MAISTAAGFSSWQPLPCRHVGRTGPCRTAPGLGALQRGAAVVARREGGYFSAQFFCPTVFIRKLYRGIIIISVRPRPPGEVASPDGRPTVVRRLFAGHPPGKSRRLSKTAPAIRRLRPGKPHEAPPFAAAKANIACRDGSANPGKIRESLQTRANPGKTRKPERNQAKTSQYESSQTESSRVETGKQPNQPGKTSRRNT